MSEKSFFYAPEPREGSLFYGVIVWDSIKGGDHQRLWESDSFKDPQLAAKAVNVQLLTKSYPDKGLKTFVIETRGN